MPCSGSTTPKGIVQIEDSQDDNGWDLCLVEPSGERSFITIPGIEQDWKDQWFTNIDLADYKYFYLSGYEMEDTEAAKVILDQLENRRSDSLILFDASPRIKHIPESIINRMMGDGFIFNANQDEIGVLCPTEDTVANQAKAIFEKTKSPVLVTLGASGTYVHSDSTQKLIPSDSVTSVVNTIGAGDTHCGGIIAGLLTGMSLPKAVELGNTLSAKVIQQQAGSLY